MKKIKLKKLLLNFGMLSLGLVTIFGAQLSLSSNASAADPKTEACTALTKIDGKACDAASTQTPYPERGMRNYQTRHHQRCWVVLSAMKIRWQLLIFQ